MTFNLQKLCVVLAFFLSMGALNACDTVGQAQTQPAEDESAASLDTVRASGTFEGKEEISTSGTYEIGRSDQDLVLVLGDDFQTESGPDLFVVLSPKGPGEATGDNVMEGAAQRIDSLRALTGEQRYILPDDINLETYDSVAIQCVKFSHLYGAAEL